ncbi:MAG: hypothetical protein MRY83_01460 [Flavobacteriales bacterium]|nr:hypothetical protein [Flavobacteriales bacterium]
MILKKCDWFIPVSMSCLGFLLSTSFSLHSQNVGINNDGSAPDPSAILDLKSTTQGILLPRMTSAQRNAIANPQSGLTVYDTDANAIFMNVGTSGSPNWAKGLTSTNAGDDIWSKSGNSSTNPTSDFIGTTDNTDFVIRSNNNERLRIKSTGEIGVGTTNPGGAFEVNSTTGGFIPPRMTTAQKNAITAVDGMIVWDTDLNCLSFFGNSSWNCSAGVQDSSAFTIGVGAACSQIQVNGDYSIGDVLTASNTVELEINVSATGQYTIETDQQNGYSFSKSGSFTQTGIQTVELVGVGTPIAAGTNNFTVSSPKSGTGSCTFSVTIPYSLEFHATNADTLQVRLNSNSGQGYSVDWGDGTVITYSEAATGQHIYSSNYTGDIKIFVDDSAAVIDFEASGEFDFNLSQINQFKNLQTLVLGLSNSVTGNLSSLPNTIVLLSLGGNNTTSGTMSSLPAGLLYYYNYGNNTTSGSIADLPSGLLGYYNQGNNSVSGSIASLPSSIAQFSIGGSNTTSGDISSLPSSIATFVNEGSNTTSGDIANLPNTLSTFVNIGNNTTSGDIKHLPSNLTTYINQGQSNTTYSGGKTSFPFYFQQESTNGLSTLEVDTLLNDYAAITWTNVSGTIDLAGSNQARSVASDAAVTSLTTAGFTISTN